MTHDFSIKALPQPKNFAGSREGRENHSCHQHHGSRVRAASALQIDQSPGPMRGVINLLHITAILARRAASAKVGLHQ